MPILKRHHLPMLLAGTLLSTVAMPALAEDTKPAATDATQPAAQPAAAPDQQSQGIGDIVVTATRRETNLQKTPIAISVVSPTMMADRHIESLINLADGSVPSLRIATFEARQSALTVGIRGIVPFDQNQTAREPGVGIYVDGIYLGRSQGLNAALFDVERIEVLRGPQGTLFGRNTEGGALSIVTKAPTGEFGGAASGGFGNYGSYDGQIHLNLPAVANIAVKLDGVMQHQDATVVNPMEGQVGWNYYNRVGGRASAQWTPFDGFSDTVVFDKAKDENTPFYSQLINYNPKGLNVGTYVGNTLTYGGNPCGAGNPCIAPLSPLVRVTGDHRQGTAEIGVPQQVSVDRTYGLSNTLKYKVAPWLELRSITGWRGVQTNQWDNSGGAHRTIFAPNAGFSRYSLSYLHQTQFSQEFQAVGSIPTLDYAVGLYYFTERVHENAATPASNKWNANGTGYTINSEFVSPPITSSNQGWDSESWFVQRDSRAVAHSYAAFGQLTWSPLDPLHITVGGRYTHDKRNGTLTIVNGVATPWAFKYNNNRFDPMVTVAYDVTPLVNVYAKYSTGYRAGGANDRSATFATFAPESVKAYEVGAKMDLFDRHVRLNLAGYMMDRKGTQIDFDHVDTNPFLPGTTIPNPTFNLHTEDTGNAPGTSKIRGVEAELTVRPIENVTLGASYAYTYTNIPLTPNPQLPGNPLTAVFVVYTPKNALSGYADIDVPVNGSGTAVHFHIDANYADAVYSFQNENVLTDPSFIVNGSIALADIRLNDLGQKVTFSVWSRNLFNETHIYRRSNANDAVLGSYANFNPPRTFGGQVSLKF